jgi:hypothetical protein
MVRSFAAFGVIALLCTASARADQPDVFKSPTVGFEVTKPASWSYRTAEQNLENIRGTKLDDEEFHALMLKYATAPLVVFAKYPEPYDDLNPSFKVNIRPIGQLQGKDPSEVLGVLLPQFEKVLKDFAVVQAPTQVEVSGIKSAYARIHYSLQIPDGRSFPTTSELWIVPRGGYFFMLGAGTRQDEKTGSRKEIEAIVKSVKIEQPDP